MNFHFENLGPLRHADIAMRDLTVVIGPNHSGKTYLAYAIHSALNALASAPWGFSLDDVLANAVSADAAIADMRMVIDNAMASMVANLPQVFQDSTGEAFRGVLASARVGKDTVPAFRQLISAQLDRLGPAVVAEKSPAEGGGPTRWLEQVRLSAARADASHAAAVATLFPRADILPAERGTLVLTYKLLSNRRYRLLRDASRQDFATRSRLPATVREQGDVSYPQPIEDFLDMLTDIELAATKQFIADPANPFHALATILEDRMQTGHRTELIDTELGGRVLQLRMEGAKTLDFHNASSAIKQLAPLVLYLRHRAKKPGMLMIDEPELNLHPENQARLIEVLAILASEGVKVFLTTHSPYILAHLNNIIAGDPGNGPVRAKQADALYLGDTRAFLRPDQVSAYEVKDGELKTLYDDDYGIRWDTLGDVSSDLLQRYFEIVAARNSPQAAAKPE